QTTSMIQLFRSLRGSVREAEGTIPGLKPAKWRTSQGPLTYPDHKKVVRMAHCRTITAPATRQTRLLSPHARTLISLTDRPTRPLQTTERTGRPMRSPRTDRARQGPPRTTRDHLIRESDQTIDELARQIGVSERPLGRLARHERSVQNARPYPA